MERTVYLKPPKEANTDKIWLLNKCVYGLADASRCWYMRVREEITKLGGEVSQLDQGLFLFYHNNKICGIITCFVDNMIYGGNAWFESNIITSLKSTFAIGTENMQAFSYVGINVKQNADKSITIDQRTYVNSITAMQLQGNRTLDDLLTEGEKTQFRGLVVQLNWICGISCPEISFETCLASTKTKSLCICDVVRLKFKQSCKASKKYQQ